MRRKVVLAVAVSAVLGVLAVTQVQSARAGASLTALDYAEIQQLYGRYAIGFDSGNGDMFAGVFTPDATLELSGTSVRQGRQQLREFAAASRGNKGPTNVNHVISNVVIEPSSDGANGTAYALLVDIGQDGKLNTLTGGGIYHDTFVKTAEGWRIKKRVFNSAHSVPRATTP